MSLFPIFKVNKLTNKKTEIIYVFIGSQEIDNISDVFQKDPTNKIFNNIFNKTELDTILKDNTEVIFEIGRAHV